MAQSYTSSEAEPSKRMTASGGMATAIYLALFGALAGVMLGTVQEILSNNHILTSDIFWDLWLTWGAVVLGAGWVTLALRYLGERRWATGALLGGVCALGLALIGSLISNMGVETKVSIFVIMVLPAMLVGLWVASRFTRVTAREATILLAASAGWVLVGSFLAWFLVNVADISRWSTLPFYLLPVMGAGEALWLMNVPLVVSAPLLVTALRAPRGAENPGRSLLWLAIGFMALPATLGLFYAAAVHLNPA